MIKRKWFVLTVVAMLLFTFLVGVVGANPRIPEGRIQPVEIIRSVVLSIVGEVEIINDSLAVKAEQDATWDVNAAQDGDWTITGEVEVINDSESPLPVAITEASLTVDELIYQVVGTGMLIPMDSDGNIISPGFSLGDPGDNVEIFFDTSSYSKIHLYVKTWASADHDVIIRVFDIYSLADHPNDGLYYELYGGTLDWV